MKKNYILAIASLIVVFLMSCEKESEERNYYAFEGSVYISLVDTIQQIDTTYQPITSEIIISIDPEMSHVLQRLVPVVDNVMGQYFNSYGTVLEEGTYYIKVETTHEDTSIDNKPISYNLVSEIDTIEVYGNVEKTFYVGKN